MKEKNCVVFFANLIFVRCLKWKCFNFTLEEKRREKSCKIKINVSKNMQYSVAIDTKNYEENAKNADVYSCFV